VSDRWFLKIDGIAGESNVVGHKDEIDVESWSWGVVNSGPAGFGGGAGAGRATFSDFQFVARISKASPKLFLASATGTHHKTASLTGAREQKLKENFATYKLSDVTVTSFQQGDAEGGPPTDQFSLNFAKIEFSYAPQRPDGSLGAAVSAGYDVQANKKL
jgi:type VI secretion system secreted protein Hcp